MAKRSSSRSLKPIEPRDAAPYVLPPSHVILIGEDEQQYLHMHAEVERSVNPVDIIEQSWVRDITDLLWEVLRQRRLKGNLLRAAIRKGLIRVLEQMTDIIHASNLANAWFRNKPGAKNEVDHLLKEAGIPFDVVIAEALAVKLGEIAEIDRQIASFEARRNTTLREISRHRDALAARLKHTVGKIEEAEFTELEDDSRQNGSLDD